MKIGDRLRQKPILKYLISTIAAVILGAIGSGVWTHVMSPLLSTSRDLTLNITTLGIEAYKNDTYRGVARGFYEAPSISILGHFINFYIFFVMIIIFYLVGKTRALMEKKSDLIAEIQNRKKGIAEEIPNYEELERKALSLKPKRLMHLLYICAFITVLNFTLMYVSLVRQNYVNKSINYFNQLISICQPYITSDKQDQLNSAFAQISNKADYVSVVSELENIAQKNKLQYQKFNPW